MRTLAVAVALQRLISRAAFVGFVALATLASGLGELVLVRRQGEHSDLMKSSGLELIRLVIPAGKEIPPHRAPGEITVQCIEGHVAFEHDGHAVDLHAGDLLHLCPQESHALKGISDSSVLVTRLRPHADELPERFPAT